MQRKCALALILLLSMSAGTVDAATFSYHGTLQERGRPADGLYDLELTLYSAPDGGRIVAGPLLMHRVSVQEGRFNTSADFGPVATAAGQSWLGVKVRNAAGGEFATLSARAPVAADATAAAGCPGSWSIEGNEGNVAGDFLGTTDAQPLELRVSGQRIVNAFWYGAGVPNWIGGGSANEIVGSGEGAFIGGGGDTSASGANAAGYYAAVGGGIGNRANGDLSAILGGSSNTVDGVSGVVAGGYNNKAPGDLSTVPGGKANVAGGYASFAAGTSAHVRTGIEGGADSTYGDYGSFVWSDYGKLNTVQPAFLSSGANQFDIRADGGVAINAPPPDKDVELTITSNKNGLDYPNMWLRTRAAAGDGILFSAGDGNGTNNAGFFVDNYNGSTQHRRMQLAPDGSAFIRSNTSGTNTGVTLPAGGGAWSSLSDRNVKTAIAAIDPLAILDRLVHMPVSEWSYTAQGGGIRHVGPMAQDFSAAFSIGEDETHISTIDADGVAFAAIQGLNQKVDAGSAALREENARLRAELGDVLARLQRLEAGQGH